MRGFRNIRKERNKELNYIDRKNNKKISKPPV